MEPQEVERAKRFWAGEDLDQVFSNVSKYLDHLHQVLKKNTATDKEFVQSLRLLQVLDLCPPSLSPDSSVVQVIIGSVTSCLGELLPVASPHHSPAPSAPPTGGQERQYTPHTCSNACLSDLPIMPQSTPLFWGENPLKVPLICGFTRVRAVMSSEEEDEGAEPEGAGPEVGKDCEVMYRAPCGLTLHNHDDVMEFLTATETLDLLQVDFFTFNPVVRLEPPQPEGPQRLELDLSRGVEPTPVELCVGSGGTRPPDFRYRKERWPHGCFLSRGSLFNSCCDCTDGCTDAQSCACIAMTTGGRHYRHHRLQEPVPAGVYECGPWCRCDRSQCQNRLVQSGIRVRLQVYQTEGRGWGVRCRDDLDRGTFVCIYAGVIMTRVHGPTEAPPPKLTRADLPSDDEVEVVTEWLAPPLLEGESNLLDPPPVDSPNTHVPVIQRPADAITPNPRPPTLAKEKSVTMETALPKVNGTKSLKRMARTEEVNFLDASREGNVSRFFNHSCQPNMFIQNVFTDSHDPGFPVIAFFTNRYVTAGSELTWNYSTDTNRKQSVMCLCGSDGCRGYFTMEDTLCNMCEGEADTQ